jgi:hypothetical protein
MVALETIEEAWTLLEREFATQLERAEAEHAEMNAAVEGDLRVRNLFTTLLPMAEQRRFFLARIRTSRYWPRLRSLCGTPPYDFLLPEDNGVLQASGICRGRTNMAPQLPHSASTTHGFGPGHYVDQLRRSYKVIGRLNSSGHQLPWQELEAGQKIVADVRLKNHRLMTKRAILSGERREIKKESLSFPRPGDEVTLSLASVLVRVALGERDADSVRNPEVRARVMIGRQVTTGSHIARLVLLIL